MHNKVLSAVEVRRIFGDFNYTKNADNTINILGNWVDKNIVTVFVPQLVGVDTGSGNFTGRVRWHKKAVEQLLRAWADVEKAGYLEDVKTWAGSFYPRLMRKTKTGALSRHSWGTAFDINVPWNQMGDTPAAPGHIGNVWRLVPIFERHGFSCGATWESPDGMHFEVCRIMDYATVTPEPAAKLVINDDVKGVIPAEIREGRVYASLTALDKALNIPAPREERMVPAAEFLSLHEYTSSWKADQKKLYAYGPKK